VVAWLGTLRVDQIFLSAVSMGELQASVYLTRRQDAGKAGEIEAWLASVETTYALVPMDSACFREYARLMAAKPDAPREDAMIASAARVGGFTVAMRNEKDFRHLGVEIFNPFKSKLMTSTRALGQFLRTLPHSAAATFLALFPIVESFGSIPIFFTMTSAWTPQERRNTAVKTGVWVFVLLVTFLFFGQFVLFFFGISLPVLKIAGGLIVANTAWGMVTSHARITPEGSHEAQGKDDI
jgi:predicted nucleic acid-binding protein